MSDAGGSTSATSEVDLASQIDQLLDGMSAAAAGLAADQTSEQIASALSEPADDASPPPAREAVGAPTPAASDAAEPAIPPPATPLDASEVESLASQLDQLVQEVAGAAPAPQGADPDARPAPQQADSAVDAVSGAEVAPPPASAPANAEAIASPAGVASSEPNAADAGAPAIDGPARARDAAAAETAEAASSSVATAPTSTPRFDEPSEGQAAHADAVASEEPTAPAADAPPESREIDLGDLDRQLAEIASTREPEPVEQAVTAGVPLPGSSVSSRAPVAAAVAAPATIAAEPGTAQAAPPSSGPSIGDRVRAMASALGGVALTGVRASAAASARAMDATPKVVRDTVGWVGLVTTFFACCMWAIVLFFRSTPVPETYGVASDVLEPHEPTPQPRPRPHAADEHAAEDSHAKEDDHGGGGDDHGGSGGGDHGGGGGGH